MVDPCKYVRFQGGGPKIAPPGTPEDYGGLGFGGVSSEIERFA